MNCIALAVLMTLAQHQCKKLGSNLEGLVFNYDRGGLWIECRGKSDYDGSDRMYFGQVNVKEKCIKF